MAEALVFETKPRDQFGSQSAKRLRREGVIPAILYGHKEATISFTLNSADFASAVKHGARVIDLKTTKGVEKSVINEIQWDHLGKDILHVDFKRVSLDERIVVTVPIEVRGTAPGIAAGGVLDQPAHHLLIECLAIAIPEHIRVNIGELQLGQAIHVRDLHLPEGVKAMGDPEAIVVHVTAKQTEPEPGSILGGTQAEPEVIGRKAAEDEAEAE